MSTYATWESDGRFGLSVGEAQSLVFGSAEARDRYLETKEARDNAEEIRGVLADLNAAAIETNNLPLSDSVIPELAKFERLVVALNQELERRGNEYLRDV